MDQKTLAAYEADAADFAHQWHRQPAPVDLHALVERFFRPGGPTADIGCGSGREVAWLSAHGFPAVTGYDPSTGLLSEARARYPDLAFKTAALPELAGIPDGSLDNVLCETVIMHLAADAIAASVRRLMAILRPGGVLYLSWRVTEGADQRDGLGRLYAAFDKGHVTRALAGATTLLDQETLSASSGKTIHRIIARKDAAP
ncbi:MAG TPA: class I SAM-dependent methyltransferase [Xanthobacteraceae bacterium]|jgi:SAM-dependent methyltransferase|nr:class I SAM-dependent methyltransferase [Xanthobacteraceae bacterium]